MYLCSEHERRGLGAVVGARDVRRCERTALGAEAWRCTAGAGVAPRTRRAAPPHSVVERYARCPPTNVARRAAATPRPGGTVLLKVFL
jgi:hypothetical protein